MFKYIFNWILITLAVFISAELLPGIELSSIYVAFVVAVVLGLINIFLKPVLLILTLPINIMTLGLFTLVINALLVMLAGAIVDGFFVDGFWWALVFSLVLSLVHFVLHAIGKK
ncbi:MAG: phage holin family protein [Candidatus Moranbacteria bacterium]|jgi:putative membrane protein|nr:phage holin family protein [Candidatus Moranbacteria bacterium]MDD5652198.1 phage holin family protein [Candidatus Moranbacteria bacterium]MDX9855905.1 phage holin family protein [Candidatus Moranbacteria bacterium]